MSQSEQSPANSRASQRKGKTGEHSLDFEKPASSNYNYYWGRRKRVPSGSYGTIFKTYRRRSDDDKGELEPVAIKAVKINKNADPPQPDKREIDTLSWLKRHPHKSLITFHEQFDSGYEDAFYGTPRTCFVFEFVEYCLGAMIDSPQPTLWTEKHVTDVLIQMLEGLAHLHKGGRVHRDIHSDNILMHREGDKYDIRITDFGLSAMFPDSEEIIETDSRAGVKEFKSPEEWDFKLGRKSDVWATGVTIYEMCKRVTPWEATLEETGGTIDKATKDDLTEKNLRNKILNTEPDWKDEIWDKQYPNVKKVLQKLLRKEYAQRPSAKEALDDPWLKTHIKPAEPLASELPAHDKNHAAVETGGQKVKMNQQKPGDGSERAVRSDKKEASGRGNATMSKHSTKK